MSCKYFPDEQVTELEFCMYCANTGLTQPPHKDGSNKYCKYCSPGVLRKIEIWFYERMKT